MNHGGTSLDAFWGSGFLPNCDGTVATLELPRALTIGRWVLEVERQTE